MLPEYWKDQRQHWQGGGRTVTVNIRRVIPARFSTANLITLAIQVRAVVVHGFSQALGAQKLIVTMPPQPMVAWRNPKASRPVSRSSLVHMRDGTYLPFSKGNGGATGWAVQYTSAARLGLRFQVRTRYQLKINAVNSNIILYDRGTRGAYLYMQKFPSLSWLP